LKPHRRLPIHPRMYLGDAHVVFEPAFPGALALREPPEQRARFASLASNRGAECGTAP